MKFNYPYLTMKEYIHMRDQIISLGMTSKVNSGTRGLGIHKLYLEKAGNKLDDQY